MHAPLEAREYGRQEGKLTNTHGLSRARLDRSGAPKIRAKLRWRHEGVRTPTISTVHAVVDRYSLVKHGRKRGYKAGVPGWRSHGGPTISGAPTTRRVHARRSRLLLPADHHRLRQALSAQLPRTWQHPGTTRSGRSRRLSRVWSARGHPHQQPRALRQRSSAVRREQALGLVAVPWDPH